MEMYIVKESLNSTRSIIKKSLNSLKESIHIMEKNREMLSSARFLMEYSYQPLEAIERMNKANCLSLPKGASLSDLKEAQDVKIDKAQKYALKLQIILSALSSEGFVKPIYDLPSIPLSWKDSGMVVPFLVISGIKINAEKKNEDDELMDEIERKLWQCEKGMAIYINEDLTIDRQNMVTFLKLYEDYMRIRYFSDDIFALNSINMEDITYNTKLMGYYIVFCNTSYFLRKNELDSLFKLCDFYKERSLVDKYEAIELACSCYFYEFKKLVNKEKEKSSEVAIDPVHEYIVDGQLVASCDLDDFKAMLDKTNMSESMKKKYLCEMEDLLAQEAFEASKKELEDLKRSCMSSREFELYNLARCYVETKNIVADIDAGVDMLREALDEENKEEIYAEIGVQLHYLERIFMPTFKSHQEESIVYYTRKVEDREGIDVDLPNILWTVLSTKILSRVKVDYLLREILEGKIARDRKIKVANLPYTVFSKGREIKIFYTKVQDTIVIIDMGFEEDGYQGIIETVKSEDFKKFFCDVQNYIAAGNKPNAVNFTDLLRTSLNRSEKIMKF